MKLTDFLLKKLLKFLILQNKEKNLLNTLTQIEYGVSIFCYKLAVKARAEKKEILAYYLNEHGNEELKHGRMLGCLSEGKNRIKPNTETGRWLDTILPGIKQVEYKGQNRGYQNFDGISRRYISAKLFFRDRKAIEYSWEDRLAYMYVLEQLTETFYIALSRTNVTQPLKAIALQISDDEKSHADYLLTELANLTPQPLKYIKKWENRAKFAIFGIIIDAINIFIIKNNANT